MFRQHALTSSLFPHLRRLFAVLFCAALLLSTLSAQQSVSVPQLVKFSGTISGAPAGTVSVIFALYKDQTGGAPLWQEVQNLTLNADGHYSTLLGAKSATGVPVDLFSSNEARWLGVQPEGQVEQSRVLLVSVPYALKASDAETLGGLPASAFLRADASAATAAPAAAAAYVNTAAVSADAAAIVAKPALTASGTNYFPVFTDNTGDVTDSALYQVVIPATATTPAITNLGFGTTTPAFNLNFVSQVDPAAIAIDGYGIVGINFIGRRAEGTLAKPTALLTNDNIMAMQGRGYGATGFSSTSRAYMKFFAAENWTDAAQGTYINFATTPTGSAIAVERLRITAPGFVGIGTSAPDQMLTVSGAVHSTTGGFVFPDNSVQTAGVPVCGTSQSLKWSGSAWTCWTPLGVSSISAGSGLTGNTAGGVLTLVADPTYLQRRVGVGCGSGSAIASINQDGTVNCQTVSGGGALVSPVDITGSPNPPTTVPGVLNVANTATGPALPNNDGPPPTSFFSTVPAAIVGTATGLTGVTAGVSATATGSSGIGVFAYTAQSNLPTLVAWNNLTGYAPAAGSTHGNWPSAINAQLMNAGGNAIQAQASATTAPVPCNGNNTPTGCGQTVGVQSEVDATSGQAIAFSGQLSSPYATGLQLNFNSPLAAGTMNSQGGTIINANVNCNGTGPCTYFQVDGNANINTSGGINTQGTSNLNGQVNANGGMSVNGQLNANSASVQNLTVQNLQVNGNLAKPMGTFKIDHPLDPANKFLYHSFVESPDMMNIYNGVIVLDKRGRAVVQLPDYFEALNQDFRYQLTAMGAPGPNLFVAGEIKGNKFVIAGGKPGAKVSWQVTGIRHDAYADAHRVVVEEDKGKERGTYLHPELFQQNPVLAKR